MPAILLKFCGLGVWAFLVGEGLSGLTPVVGSGRLLFRRQPQTAGPGRHGAIYPVENPGRWGRRAGGAGGGL